MKTEILKIKGDWMEVASDCRSTVGKPPLDHEPSVDFKKKILISEMKPCGNGKCYFDVLMEKTGGLVSSTHIDERYEAYNKLFYRQKERAND